MAKWRFQASGWLCDLGMLQDCVLVPDRKQQEALTDRSGSLPVLTVLLSTHELSLPHSTCIAPCTHPQTIQSHSCQNTSMACPALSDWFNYNNFISSSILHHVLALFWKCWFIYMSFLAKETAVYLRDATFFYSPFLIFQRINSCMQINGSMMVFLKILLSSTPNACSSLCWVLP